MWSNYGGGKKYHGSLYIDSLNDYYGANPISPFPSQWPISKKNLQ